MPEKITYIFGAGASAQAIPLSRPVFKDGKRIKKDDQGNVLLTLSERFKKIFGELSNTPYLKNEENRMAHLELLEAIESRFNGIIDDSKEFYNIDSFAKYLYLNDDKRRHDLKFVIAAYFSLEQYMNEKFDTRYLSFLISLLNDDGEIPSHVNFISWNYDYQFQIAHQKLKSSSRVKSLDFVPNTMGDGGPFKLAQLNGIAGRYFVGNHVRSLLHDSIPKIMEQLEKEYKLDSNLFTFAWEKTPTAANYLKKAFESSLEMAKDTTILVVIGYSFPFYNREIDNQIIGAMKDSLRKIYFQDPYSKGDYLIQQYNLSDTVIKSKEEVPIRIDGKIVSHQIKEIMGPVEIDHISSKDQFYIPYEL